MVDQMQSGNDFLASVQAFVSEKWKKHNPCDRCGSFEWSILPGRETVFSLTATNPEDTTDQPPRNSVELIPVYCNNCGNTVNIFMGVFTEWLTKHQTT